MDITTLGIDLAKRICFQVHGVDGQGRTVVQRQLRRAQLLGLKKRNIARSCGLPVVAPDIIHPQPSLKYTFLRG